MAAGLLAQGTVQRAGPALIRVVDDDPDPAVRTAALEALATLGGPPIAVTAAMACLLDADERVRAAALRTLAALGVDAATIDTHPWIEGLARDPSPAVRGALACLYSSHGPDPRSTKIVLDLLAGPGDAERLVGLETDRRLGGAIPANRVTRLVDDPSGAIRAAALATLASRQDRDRAQVDVELVRALDDDVAEVRDTAAQALSDRESTPLGLLDVLSSGSNRAQEAALIALRGHGPDVRQAVIAWTLGRLERATELRRARAMLAGSETGRPAPGTGTRLPAGGPLATGGAHDRARSSCPGRARGAGGRRRDPALPPLRRCRGPGAGDRGPRLHRRPRAPAGPRAAPRRRGDRCAGSRCRACPAGR